MLSVQIHQFVNPNACLFSSFELPCKFFDILASHDDALPIGHFAFALFNIGVFFASTFGFSS